MRVAKWENDESYRAQSDIVRRALSTADHSLEELVRLMRETGQAAVYLSGSRLDSDYCFGSGDIGVLFSVLPEDAGKAAVPGYHPGSTEVYVTFQGSLVMERLKFGHVTTEAVGQNGVLVLPPGECHRVRYDAQRKAASLIVKTNLRQKPGVVRCDACTYYRSKDDCPLHQSWAVEGSS